MTGAEGNPFHEPAVKAQDSQHSLHTVEQKRTRSSSKGQETGAEGLLRAGRFRSPEASTHGLEPLAQRCHFRAAWALNCFPVPLH